MPGRVPSASLDAAAAGLRAAAAVRGDVLINSLIRNVNGLQRGRGVSDALDRRLRLRACLARAPVRRLSGGRRGTDRARLFLGGAECGRGPRAERLERGACEKPARLHVDRNRARIAFVMRRHAEPSSLPKSL